MLSELQEEMSNIIDIVESRIEKDSEKETTHKESVEIANYIIVKTKEMAHDTANLPLDNRRNKITTRTLAKTRRKMIIKNDKKDHKRLTRRGAPLPGKNSAEGLAEGPRRRFRDVQGVQVKNRRRPGCSSRSS